MNVKPYIIGIVIAMLALLLFGLYNNRAGNDAVGEQLRNIGQSQRTITSGIDATGKSVAELKGEIDKSGETVNRVKANVRDAGEIIRECKSILKAVRERDKGEDPKG